VRGRTAPTIEDLVQRLLAEWRTFVDTSKDYRKLNVAYTILSYNKSKLITLPYLGYFGDTESGKGRRAEPHEHLDYRAFNGVDITTANLFQFVAEVGGELIEDEIHIDRDSVRQAIWKSGYKASGRTSRIVQNEREGRRPQVFYSTFGPKIALGENLPHDKGLLERFIIELTEPGSPEKDEIGKEDLARFAELRRLLLIRKIRDHDMSLPDISVPFKGRAKELYKPLLQVVYGTSIYDDLLKFLQNLSLQRTASAQRTWEALLTKAVIVTVSNDGVCTIRDVRTKLTEYSDGEPDYRGMNIIGIRSNELGRITNRGIAQRLRVLFDGKSVRSSPEPLHQGRGWELDLNSVLLEAKKYQLDRDTETVEIGQRKLTVGDRARELAALPILRASLEGLFDLNK
jgi:hypothetical protein